MCPAATAVSASGGVYGSVYASSASLSAPETQSTDIEKSCKIRMPPEQLSSDNRTAGGNVLALHARQFCQPDSILVLAMYVSPAGTVVPKSMRYHAMALGM